MLAFVYEEMYNFCFNCHMYGFRQVCFLFVIMLFFYHILFTRVVQSELVHLRSVHWIITRKFISLFIAQLPFYFGLFFGLFVRFSLFLIRIGRIKQLHFDLFAIGYVHENVRSNQFALTNLHLSVSYFFQFSLSSKIQRRPATRRGRGRSAVGQREGFFWSNFAVTFTPCLGKLLASTVQCHRSRRNVTTSRRSISF